MPTINTDQGTHISFHTYQTPRGNFPRLTLILFLYILSIAISTESTQFFRSLGISSLLSEFFFYQIISNTINQTICFFFSNRHFIYSITACLNKFFLFPWSDFISIRSDSLNWGFPKAILSSKSTFSSPSNSSFLTFVASIPFLYYFIVYYIYNK